MTFSNFIASVPDSIWAGVIGACAALGGVIVSNLSNGWRQKAQLNHDSEEKAKDRKDTLRREVYLKTAEELVKANMHVANLPNMRFDEGNPVNGASGFFISVAKLQLISDVKTSMLVADLAATYSDIMMSLVIKAGPIRVKVDAEEYQKMHYERNQQEVTRILADMKHYNESLEDNPARFAALQQSFTYHQSQATFISAERQKLSDEKNKMYIEYARGLIDDMKPAMDQNVYVLAAIRQELHLDGSVEDFLQMLRKQERRMRASMEKTLAEVAK